MLSTAMTVVLVRTDMDAAEGVAEQLDARLSHPCARRSRAIRGVATPPARRRRRAGRSSKGRLTRQDTPPESPASTASTAPPHPPPSPPPQRCPARPASPAAAPLPPRLAIGARMAAGRAHQAAPLPPPRRPGLPVRAPPSWPSRACALKQTASGEPLALIPTAPPRTATPEATVDYSSRAVCREQEGLLEDQRAGPLRAERRPVPLDEPGDGPPLLRGRRGRAWVRSDARGVRKRMALRACA